MLSIDPQVSLRRQAGRAALVPLLETKKRGDMITYAEIDATTGQKNESVRYVGFIKRWFQRNRGILLLPVVKVGYRCIAAAEHIDVGHSRAKRARRELRKEATAYALTPTAELTPEKLRELDHLQRSAAIKIAGVEAQDQTTKQLFGGRPPPLPRLK